MSGALMPVPVRLYTGLAPLLLPLAYQRVRRKLGSHGTDPARFSERLGHAGLPRPAGDLMWFHAASVGESLSVLRLIAHLGAMHPRLNFLLTTGTATSAEILARRLPPRCQHQFAPLDSPRAMRRFLAHWAPSAAVFVESELWPNMLIQTGRARVPMALLNARISDRSARKWKRMHRSARYLLGHFALIHAQDARTATHLHELGLTHATHGQNLKSVAGPLPYDCAAHDALGGALAQRPLWVASSTHPGEDEIMLAAHAALLADHPDLLLILVPRHPNRAADIETLIGDHGLSHATRSTGGALEAGTQVYLADTMGETGLFYALSPIVCLGGSFTPVGGHNPYEPAYAGAAVLHGPLVANFEAAYAEFDASGGAVQVADAGTLAAALDALLLSPDRLAAQRAQAGAFAAAQEDGLDDLSQTLSLALALR